ncbi:phenylacetate-CoA oxygenase subunit PaaJ, partial [Escherichia coli]|nr:phenylacetate-CoA oxygenase subunit PaaJ [Escherichia coli]
MSKTIADAKDLFAIASKVTDPEIPVLSIADLGILREVNMAEDGTVQVVITPTYS